MPWLPAMTLLLAAPPAADRDAHSFAAPAAVRVTHIALALDVDFDRKQLRGTATLSVVRPDPAAPLTLDSRGLTITAVTAGGAAVPYTLGKADPLLGQALTVTLPAKADRVTVAYATGPEASALQWLTPAQTAGKKLPLLFTQSQAIDARSWVPCQDSPGVRVTYEAVVRTPPGLVAVMSAEALPPGPGGEFRFKLGQPVPSYLMALAVGDLRFRKLGPRTGVYAEPSVLAKAAAEFADVEEMMAAAEKLYGPYRWGRYDVLVMPPSFPFGGMENPRLTFASPTVLAGDKSLVALLAHELAHSWSGNLVSNATWRDFWLNEGFTVYLERRIMEAVYGKARADIEAVLGKRGLEKELATMPKADQVLHIDLTGRPPVDGLTDVPYEKGALFLTHLEAVYGRPKLDAFLAGYFKQFQFQSITTATFAAYLDEHLLKGDTALAAKANVKEWLYAPGLPADAPRPAAAKLVAVEEHARAFLAGTVKAAVIPAGEWSTQEWLHFLGQMPAGVGKEKLAELDAAFGLTKSGNSEVTFAWLMLTVPAGYAPADARLEAFLTEQGRRKFLKPLYEALMKTPAGAVRAKAIYARARPTYHPASAETIDAIVGR